MPGGVAEFGRQINLAVFRGVCFIDFKLQQERKFSALWPVAKSSLAGLLVVLLLLAAILAANPFHRQLSHAETLGDGHLCIICLFAGGLVSSLDVVFSHAAPVSGRSSLTVLVEAVVLPDIDLRLSQGRAPPSFFHSHVGVGRRRV